MQRLLHDAVDDTFSDDAMLEHENPVGNAGHDTDVVRRVAAPVCHLLDHNI